MATPTLKLRVTESEFLRNDNHWATVYDQRGRVWLFQSQRRVRGTVLELTYA